MYDKYISTTVLYTFNEFFLLVRRFYNFFIFFLYFKNAMYDIYFIKFANTFLNFKHFLHNYLSYSFVYTRQLCISLPFTCYILTSFIL